MTTPSPKKRTVKEIRDEVKRIENSPPMTDEETINARAARSALLWVLGVYSNSWSLPPVRW